jgi:hypothetical protein
MRITKKEIIVIALIVSAAWYKIKLTGTKELALLSVSLLTTNKILYSLQYNNKKYYALIFAYKSINNYITHFISHKHYVSFITIVSSVNLGLLYFYSLSIDIVLVTLVIDPWLKLLISFIKCRKIRHRLYMQYKGKVDLLYFSKNEITLYSTVPLDIKVDIKDLELILNATIIRIRQGKIHKNRYTINTLHGIDNDIRNATKLSKERLNLILVKAGDNPDIETCITETHIVHTISTTLTPTYFNKHLNSIEYKLAANKNSCTVDYKEGKTVLSIRTTGNKYYCIDKYLANNNKNILFGINKDSENPFYLEWTNIGHLLIGGMTGSGKSSMLHTLIWSIMYKRDNVAWLMVDLKGTELPYAYADFRNTKVAGIADGMTIEEGVQACTSIFKTALDEYEKRLMMFKLAGCKDITAYNRANKPIPSVIFLIDEANTIFELIKPQYKESYEYWKMVLDTLFARGRSTGIFCWHTLQSIRESEYALNFRRSMMTRICMLMKEPRQCQMVLDCTQDIADKASKQSIGEAVLISKENVSYDLISLRINDKVPNECYKLLVNKYKKRSVKDEVV